MNTSYLTFAQILKYIKRCLLLTILFALIGCSKQERAIIHMKIDHANNKIAYLNEIDSTGLHALDSIVIGDDGNIKFKIPIGIPGFYQLRLDDERAMVLLLFPGERVNISADYNKFFDSKKVDATKETQRLIMLDDSLHYTNLRLIRIAKLYDSLKVSAKQESLDSLSVMFNEIMTNHKKNSIGCILEDMKSLSNVMVMYQQYFTGDNVFNSLKDLQFFKLVSDTLTRYYPKVTLVQLLKKNYETMLEGYQREKISRIINEADNHVPDLQLPDKNGNQVSLSSFRGKWVLLTFWSINQPESNENLIELKKVYQQYHRRGFEIYQVSIDKSLSDWRRALLKKDISWVSVCDTAFPESKTRNLFNINSLPLNYFVSKDQINILAKNITPNDLDVKLSELLK